MNKEATLSRTGHAARQHLTKKRPAGVKAFVASVRE